MELAALWKNPFAVRDDGPDRDLRFLSDVAVFHPLSNRQRRKVASLMHTRTFDPGEIVFRKGDPGVGMYVICSGSVEIYNEYPDHTRSLITGLSAGDFFGEISLLNDSPRSATVITVSSSVLYGLFRHDLINLMNSDPALGVKLVYRLAQIVSERLRITNECAGE